jgi:hypothetical protein
MTLHVFAVMVLGLMCGSELNVAAFAHPLLSRHPLNTHIPKRIELRNGRLMLSLATGESERAALGWAYCAAILGIPSYSGSRKVNHENLHA